MAATLSFLQLPLLSRRYQQQQQQQQLPSKITISNAQLSGHSNNSQKLLQEAIHLLKSASLPLGAFALPLLLDSEACNHQSKQARTFFSYLFFIYFSGTGCTCSWGRVWDSGRNKCSFGSPHCHDWLVFLNFICGISWLAMEASPQPTE